MVAYGAGVRRTVVVLMIAAVVMACSSAEPRQTNPTLTVPALVPETTTTVTTPVADGLAGPTADLTEVAGVIAVSDPLGLTIRRPTGEVVADLAPEFVVRQPTWNRSGDRLVATLIDPNNGATGVGFVDAAGWTLETTGAARPYFFYSWSHAGDRIAALGPSDSGGTSVDFIDSSGRPAADRTVAGGSMFVAFEPGGGDVLLHANASMFLLDELALLEDPAELGSPGIGFQAASWIPGTRQFLFARVDGTSVSLIRQDADDGETTDLGELDGFVAISVHPQGTVAAISHGTVGEAVGTGDVEVAATEPRAAVELVDLATGARTQIIDRIGLWLEWSPTGERLLIGVEDRGELAWHVWDGERVEALVRLRPTPTFLQQYLPFADQYVESPRLWSPDGEAFVVSAEIDGRGQAVVVDAETGATAVLGPAQIAFWSPAG